MTTPEPHRDERQRSNDWIRTRAFRHVVEVDPPAPEANDDMNNLIRRAAGIATITTDIDSTDNPKDAA